MIGIAQMRKGEPMLTIDDVIERFDGSLAYSTNSKEICQYIADLLKELKERRKAPEIVRCGECQHKSFCSSKIDCGDGLFYCIDFCSNGKRAERRNDE